MKPLPPWLDKPYAELVADLEHQRLPHALLIQGPGGWGESVLAAALALRLIEQDTNGPDATLDAAAIAHPDLRWVVPEDDSRQIVIDTVRATVEFIVRTPQIAPRKVAVIPSADAMNNQSANALLKTLEEPPPDSYIILVSDSARDLLPTLRSRCRLVPVRPPGDESPHAWISEQVPGASAAHIAALYFEYGGAPYRVIAALARDEQPISELLHAVATGKSSALRVAEAWRKIASAEFFERWMRYVTRAIATRLAGREALENPVSRVLKDVNEHQLFQLWEQLARNRQLLRGTTNPNAQLLLESSLLAWRDLTTPA